MSGPALAPPSGGCPAGGAGHSPVDDPADAAVIEILSEALNLPRRHVAIVSGAQSRSKTLALSGITPDEVRQRLSVILGHPV